MLHPPPLNPAELRNDFQMFRPFIIRNLPQMALLISIALIIPVSAAPRERGLSATNWIKTKLRNRL